MSVDKTLVLVVVEDGCGDIELPAYQSEQAAGMDVRAAVEGNEVIEPGQIKLIPTGLRMAIPAGYEIQVRPRSGMALKHGIIVVNSPGTIDADYRGLIGVILSNIGSEPFVIHRGDRIAQLVMNKVERVRFKTVESLDESTRGEGGFCSTGVN